MAATIAMADLGNSLQFTLANGNIFILNKLNLQIKQDDTYVYLTDAGGFIDSALNKVVRLSALEVGATVGGSLLYADNDALLTGILGSVSSLSLGGGGAGGGGNNTWSNTQKNFTATPTVGANTITIAGLPFTLEDGQVALGSIKKIDSTGDVQNLQLTNVTVSGNVITLGDEDNFATGDTVEVVLFGEDKAYDQAIDGQLSYVLNQDSEKWTSPEHLVDLSAQAAATLRYVIPMEGYKDLSMHWKFSNSDAGDTVTMTLWATNNSAADDSADTDWVDVTSDFLSKTLTVTNGTIEFAEVLKELFFMKVMVKLVIASTSTADTNAVDIYIKKKAL